MDSNQEAKLSMYIKVQQFLTEKLPVLTALFSIITSYKTTLDDFIQDIFDADAIATADTTGYSEAKQEKRDEIVTQALRISGAGAAYYKTLGDPGSQNEIYFNPTELTHAQDTVVYTKVMQVHRLANAAGAALAPHGITVGDISNLNVGAQQYLALLELPKRKVSAKAAQGKKVDNIMSDTDDFLKETLDPQMRVLIGTADEELFDEYEGNRGIDDNPSGGGTGDVFTLNVGPGSSEVVNTPGVIIAPGTAIKIEVIGGPFKTWFATNAGDIPLVPFAVTDNGEVAFLVASDIGFSPSRLILKVQNDGMAAGTIKITIG